MKNMNNLVNKLQLIVGVILALLTISFSPSSVSAKACPLSFKCFVSGVLQSTCDNKICDNYKREEPELLCKKYGITFPVKDLGNCPDYASCRKYCFDPVNSGKCFQFGKDKGISPKEVSEQDIRLGFKDSFATPPCDNPASCKAFCDQKENFDKCSEFAKTAKVVGGYIDNPGNDNIISKAKNVLGCSSPSDCASFCTKPENQQKCTSFAGNVGLAGGERKVGPGGCTSSETCSSFCQDPQNKDKCAGFIVTSPRIPTPKPVPVTDQNPGPGGCTSEETCDSFCSDPKNAEECKKYEESSGYQWSGPGGCTSAASCAAYCKTNYTDPECGGGSDLQQYEQQKQQNLQQFQQMEGQKQQYLQQMQDAEQQKQSKQQEYEGAQQQYQQKKLEEQQMQGQYDAKQQEYNQMQGQYDQKQQEYNQMQQSQPQAPPTGVQGVTTTRGLLQLIIDALFRR